MRPRNLTDQITATPKANSVMNDTMMAKKGKRNPVQETSERGPRYGSENWLRWEAKNTDFAKDILKKLLLEA